jgi:hypothetical protein
MPAARDTATVTPLIRGRSSRSLGINLLTPKLVFSRLSIAMRMTMTMTTAMILDGDGEFILSVYRCRNRIAEKYIRLDVELKV